MYLTFEEYQQYGGKQTEQEFGKNVIRAESTVDVYTQDRLKAFEEIPTAVKVVVSDLVDYFSIISKTEKPLQSRSQSAGGVSESETYSIMTADEETAGVESLLFPLRSIYTASGVCVMHRGAGK